MPEGKLTSWGWNARSSRKTWRISFSFSRGMFTTMVKALASPRCFMTSPSLLVAITISFLPLGGCFSSSSRMICSRLLEKRGPMGTYSTSLSMLSNMTRDAGDCVKQRLASGDACPQGEDYVVYILGVFALSVMPIFHNAQLYKKNSKNM